ASIIKARKIIAANKFNLQAASTGNQATYRAFDVKEVYCEQK
ncbi:MAG: hypothetical protein JWQ57_3222, partial [Mucilaginibacter sp.]|nr:hypothetical protein [Mucilaginibacter sp.]